MKKVLFFLLVLTSFLGCKNQPTKVQSVEKAFRHIGANPIVTNDPDIIASADRLVLPGVGAFQHCMQGLETVHLTAATKVFIQTGKPFLGICVGLQMLFEVGDVSCGHSVDCKGFFVGIGEPDGKLLNVLNEGTAAVCDEVVAVKERNEEGRYFLADRDALENMITRILTGF